MSDLTLEKRAECMKMALLEVGVRAEYRRVQDITGKPYNRWTGVDRPTLWRAAALVAIHEIGTCWPCYQEVGRVPGGCTHDPLTSPWPEVVR